MIKRENENIDEKVVINRENLIGLKNVRGGGYSRFWHNIHPWKKGDESDDDDGPPEEIKIEKRKRDEEEEEEEEEEESSASTGHYLQLNAAN